MKFPLKVIYIQDDNEYMAFLDGLSNISGFGETEEEAIADMPLECEDWTMVAK